ncbi:hypothetical protein ACQ4PT_069037 [Festuca glaucescens]
MGPPAQDAAAASSSSSPSGGSSRGSSRRGPRLERRNASKHIPYQYDQELYCSYPPSSPPPPRASSGPAASTTAPASLACSVDLSSFRIGGSGDVQLLCRNLGLSGPDDFAISITDWEAHKAYRSSTSSSASTSPSSRSQRDRPQARESPLRPEPAEVPAFSLAPEFNLPAKQTTPTHPPARPAWLDPQEPARPDARKPGCEGGIKGIRPPPVMLKQQPTMLKPPPSMARLPQPSLVCSTWDILQSFAPEEEQGQAPAIRSARDFGCEEDEDEAEVLTLDDLRLGDTSEEFTGMSSISTTNDDETADSMFYISPNGRFKRKIRSWSRGMLLGSGSFGTVYEGISDEGVFFAVKEVSLHDQGSNAQQCIFQLEQVGLLGRLFY